MSRKRGYVRMEDKLAAALACLLLQEQRDELRRGKVPAADILALFEWDHIVLHAHDGSDLWWNLDPKLVAVHREKSRRDTAIVAKVRRLRANAVELPIAGFPEQEMPLRDTRKYKWPKRKIPSRPFWKRS